MGKTLGSLEKGLSVCWTPIEMEGGRESDEWQMGKVCIFEALRIGMMMDYSHVESIFVPLIIN